MATAAAISPRTDTPMKPRAISSRRFYIIILKIRRHDYDAEPVLHLRHAGFLTEPATDVYCRSISRRSAHIVITARYHDYLRLHEPRRASRQHAASADAC